MTAQQKTAINKLKAELQTVKKGNYKDALKQPIYSALEEFAIQCDDFAEAIAQATDKTLDGCIDSISAGSPKVLSDLDAYTRAALYYFPTAVVSCELKIYPDKHSAEAVPDEPNITLDLFGLMGM